MKFSLPLITSCFLILVFSSSITAQTKKPARTKLQRETVKLEQWEYCVVSLSNTTTTAAGKYIGRAVITYLDETEKADLQVEVTNYPNDNFLSRRKVLAKAFAQLGNAGWELVSSTSFNYGQGYAVDGFYFKRRKR